MKPSRPSKDIRSIRGTVSLGAMGVWLFATPMAPAEEPSAPASTANTRSIADSDLRPASPGDLTEEVRRPSPFGQSRTLPPAQARDIVEPYGRGAPDAAPRRPEDADPDTRPGEDAEPPETAAEPDFDLFEGPEQGPARRDNLATAPAAAGGAFPDPAALPDEAAAGRASPAERQSGLLVDAQQRGIRTLELGVPASPVTGRTAAERIGGRVNLPATALRPSVPIARDDAFAPVGTRVGSFVLYSTLDQRVGASTNLGRSPGGASGGLSETELSARLLSDWSRHEAELNGLASYRRNFEGEVESEPRLSLDGRLRLDVDRLTAATFTGAVQYRREDPVDLLPTDSASDRPEIVTYSAGAKVERDLGRARLGLDATTVRETTETDGRAGPRALDETYTTTSAGLRAGYELTPALQPFVAGSIGQRVFDEDRDFDGLERGSLIEALRGGLAFDLGEKFLGEVAVGYAWNVPDDDALETTAAPTIEASIAWSPQRGTDLVLAAATSFDPGTVRATTATLYEGSIALRHRVTARTDLTATLSAAYRDTDLEIDRERSYAAEAGFVHWLNRSLAVTGLVRHERLDAERTGGDYSADTVKVGLRLQR